MGGVRVELRELLRALMASWWVILAGGLLGAIIASAFSFLSTPYYASNTQLFVSARDTVTTSEAFQGSQLSEQRVSSYAQLLTGNELARRVIDRLDLDLSPSDLSNEITATAVADTVLINVTVLDPSADRAQAIAAAVGTEFASLVEELETSPGDAGVSPVRVTVTDEASLATAPSSPNLVKNVALGLLLGLVLGFAAAIVRSRLDRTCATKRATRSDSAGLAQPQ
jgi:receptor protein-tyrosine kinase